MGGTESAQMLAAQVLAALAQQRMAPDSMSVRAHRATQRTFKGRGVCSAFLSEPGPPYDVVPGGNFAQLILDGRPVCG